MRPRPKAARARQTGHKPRVEGRKQVLHIPDETAPPGADLIEENALAKALMVMLACCPVSVSSQTRVAG